MRRACNVNPFIEMVSVDSGDLKRDLSEVINLYFLALNWSLSWVRQKRRNIPQNEIGCFTLNNRQIALLRLDLGDILRRLSRRSFNTSMQLQPPLDYWSQAIKRYAFRVTADRLEWSSPGFEVPDIWRVERLEFVPNPHLLPLDFILEAFRGYGLPLGLEPDELVFVHDGLAIESAVTLVNNVMAASMDTPLVMAELRRWRDMVFERISQAGGTSPRIQATVSNTTSCDEDESLLVPEPEEERVEEPIDPRLIGHMVKRSKIASILDRTTRTIKNWDSLRYAPGGLVWHPADVVNSNGALYDISRNWGTIMALSARTRDHVMDRQLSQEIFEQNGDDGDYGNL